LTEKIVFRNIRNPERVIFAIANMPNHTQAIVILLINKPLSLNHAQAILLKKKIDGVNNFLTV